MEKDKDNKLRQKHLKEASEKNIVPFETVEEVWFWFVLAQQAKVDGARYTAGLSLTPRPCEPSDILKILNNLYRNRMLLWDHLLVLRHYGRRQLAPDPRRVKEARAYKLWGEALKRLEPIFIRKGIMREKKDESLSPNKAWVAQATIYSSKLQDGVEV